MEATSIKATELRTRTREIIERARFKGERFIIRNFGKPVAVILGIEEYIALMKTVQNLDSPSPVPLSDGHQTNQAEN